MIAWWWVLVALTEMWLFFFIAAAVSSRDLRDEVTTGVLTVALLPLLGVVWVLTRLNLGVYLLHADTLERFAAARTSDGLPAYGFFVGKNRGLIILRRWEVTERPSVAVRRGEPS